MDYCLDKCKFSRIFEAYNVKSISRKSEHKKHLDNLKLWYKTFLKGLKGLKYIQNILAHSSSLFKELWGFKSWLFDSFFLRPNDHLNNFVVSFETCWNSSRGLSLTCFDLLHDILQAKIRFKVSIFKFWVHWTDSF